MFAAGLLLAATTAAMVPPPSFPDGVAVAELVFRSHVVVRVRTVPATPIPKLAAMFREKKGPHCIAMGDMQAAAVLVRGSVDVALRGGSRVRLRFAASCPALAYYSGFYIAPTGDAMICAGRDTVRDRAGGECAVDRIRALVPRK